MPVKANQIMVMVHLHLNEDAGFRYLDRSLVCDSVSLADIAGDYGTPTYVYSLTQLTRNAEAYLAAAGRLRHPSLVCYAVKANGNPEILRILANLGLGADIVSGGELFLALSSGFDPQHIVFSGVGKTRQEIQEAITAGILALHVESLGEQQLVSQVARSLAVPAPIAVRVNPDIQVDTHAHIATGGKSHKFGVASDLARQMMLAAQADPWLTPKGLSAHLGSQISSLEPFEQIADRLTEMADELAAAGLRLDYIDIGGGLAIDYGQGSGLTIESWLERASVPIVQREYRLLVEPGRSIVGPAGVLLARVLYTKQQGDQSIIVTDAGMNDLMRPALYGARHPILPVSQPEASRSYETNLYDIVGPICESADVLARASSLPTVAPGDLLAVMQAGAYGYVMSNNYNGRPRPAEVLVSGDSIRCIRSRERYNDLLGRIP